MSLASLVSPDVPRQATLLSTFGPGLIRALKAEPAFSSPQADHKTWLPVVSSAQAGPTGPADACYKFDATDLYENKLVAGLF